MRVARLNRRAAGLRHEVGRGVHTAPGLNVADRYHSSSVAAFTLVEVVMGAMILGVLTLAFCACLSTGFSIVQSVRENLRATQILLQRSEAIRMFNWAQLQNTNYLKPTFTEVYDPSSSANTAGTTFYGTVTLSTPTNLPAAYAANMRTVTISLSWTNYNGRQRIPRTRTLQAQVARYGMQNYVFGSQ